MSLNNIYNTVLSPIISEKSNRIGEQSNQYVFQVAVSSNKKQVKAAIEKLFEVKVEDVQILNVKGERLNCYLAVSYTHLTLPTICSV